MLACFTIPKDSPPGTADRILADLARGLREKGVPLAGLLRRGHGYEPLLEPLGKAGPCLSGSERAAALAAPGLRAARLVILPEFGAPETGGGRFAPLIAAAMARDLPVILHLPSQHRAGFADFGGDPAQTVAPDRLVPWAFAQAAPPLDARDLLCPLPVLRLRKALAALPGGAALRVRVTDRMALVDLPHFCEGAGHAIIARHDLRGGVMEFTVVKAAPDTAPNPAKAPS